MIDKEKALELAKDYAPTIENMDAEIVLYDAILEMSQWKEHQMIDKACEWLKENTSCYASFDDDIISDKENKNNFINDFKQAMEE